jgi:hypothetical protein
MIKEILFIPIRFYSESNISTYNLLKDTGYFENYKYVTPNAILEALKQYPECVKGWIMLSNDKRTDTGWYLIEQNGGGIVGYFPDTIDKPSRKFADLAEACAHFIMLEIEERRSFR